LNRRGVDFESIEKLWKEMKSLNPDDLDEDEED